MFTKKFWMDAAERIIATAAQALLATLTITNLNWGDKFQVTGVAAAAALLKALVATRVGDSDSAALLPSRSDT